MSPAPFSLATSSTARRSAVRCCAVSCLSAVPCCAQLCRAVPYFAVLSLSSQVHTRRQRQLLIASIQSWREPACIYVLDHVIQQQSYFPFFFPPFFSFAVPVSYVYSNKQQYCSSIYVRVCMSLNREHSTAQRHPPYTKQQTKYVPTRVRVKISISVRTSMLRSVCFPGAWSSWPFVSRLFAPNVLDHLLTAYACHSNSFFLASQRSGRSRPLREAPCKNYEKNTTRKKRKEFRDEAGYK